MSLHRFLSIAALVSLAGCATADRVQQLEERLSSLEKKVEEVAKNPGPSKPTPKDEKAEKAASDLYSAVTKAMQSGNIGTAKAKLAELKGKYSNTTAYRRARKLERELEVIGKAAPKTLGEVQWLANEVKVDLHSDTPTLLVFWEVWCPHCRREVPKIEATANKYSGKLNVVGLTKITRSATEDSVNEFIAENKLTYPLAKENGDLSKHFNVSGIPAAAAVKDGKIVWRGHPGRLTDDMIAGWL